MRRLWEALLAMVLGSAVAAQPARGISPDKLFALSLLAGQDSDTLLAALHDIDPRLVANFRTTAADLPADLADPAYFYFEARTPEDDTDGRDHMLVICTQMGRANVLRVLAGPRSDLGGRLPNALRLGTTIDTDATVLLDCLIQFWSLDPQVPLAVEDVVPAMQAYPGSVTQARQMVADPDGAMIATHEVGLLGQGEVRPGLRVPRLTFATGILGQDITLTAFVTSPPTS